VLRQKVTRWSHVLALVLFWPALAWVIWGELTPSPELEQHFWDKGLHFLAYFGLAGLATVALNARRMAIFAPVGLIAVGGALEIVQGMVGRDCSLYDELANSAGACIGWLCGWLLMNVLGPRPR
jgi:VanZ family protein